MVHPTATTVVASGPLHSSKCIVLEIISSLFPDLSNLTLIVVVEFLVLVTIVEELVIFSIFNVLTEAKTIAID